MIRSPRVVVFDLGEVLASPGELLAELAARAGVDDAALTRAYWAHRDPHDLGVSAHEYWTTVLTAVGSAPRDGLVPELADHDCRRWTTLRPDALAVLADLRAAGVRLAVLSNAPRELAAVARTSAWGAHIDHWFFSGELGLAKPDRRLYDLVRVELGVAAPDILFFDDRESNVVGALDAGWDAVRWTSGPATRSVLVDRGLLK